MKRNCDRNGAIRALCVGLALFAPAALRAAEPARQLTGAEVKDLFNDATVSGRYMDARGPFSSQGYFSEYHGTDGRALGNNGFSPNIDACWNVDDDGVCYHYGQPDDRRTYCFTVERAGDTILLRVRQSGQLNAIAKVEKGNPRGHTTNGENWSCDGLISRAPLPEGWRSRVARLRK